MIGVDISSAARILNEGNLVGIPTETVYGLAANALDAKAVSKIFIAKKRPFFDPLILHTFAIDQLSNWVQEVPLWAQSVLEKFSPGGLTVLLPKRSIIPEIVTSGLPRVGIRIPNHPLTLKLLESVDFPLAAPSANPFGYISPTLAVHVEKQLGDQIDYILDGGACSVGLESTIIGEENGKITLYRVGAIALEDIEQHLDTRLQVNKVGSKPAAPGMLDIHYAPKKQLILGSVSEVKKLYPSLKLGHLAFNNLNSQADIGIVLSKSGNLAEAAQGLFGAMRQLDESDVDIIVADTVPNISIGVAINDRLSRASGGGGK